MFVLLCRLGRLFTTRMTNTFNGEGTSDAVDNNVANGQNIVDLDALCLVFHGGNIQNGVGGINFVN